MKETDLTSAEIAVKVVEEFGKKYGFTSYDRSSIDDINDELQIRTNRVSSGAKRRYAKDGDKSILNPQKQVNLYYRGDYVSTFESMADAARHVAEMLGVDYKIIQSSSLLKKSRGYSYKGYQLIEK